MIIADPVISQQNSYVGGITQQATSVTTRTDPNSYEFSGGRYATYGFEVRVASLSWIYSGDNNL